MFEFAELGHRVAKAAYQREEPKLREQLLEAQYDLNVNDKFSTLVVIAGMEGAGKGETIHLLNEWMDPRHVLTHGFADPSDEERERPQQVPFKRFKITPEDWRNRSKWDEYEQAVCDMVDRTSTRVAPWTLVEANNKYYARIKVLKTLCEALEHTLRG